MNSSIELQSLDAFPNQSSLLIPNYPNQFSLDSSNAPQWLPKVEEGFSTPSSEPVPDWHFSMMNDKERNDAFYAALKAHITPETVVLDIGTGAGLLSLVAAKLGAKKVYTCEKVAPVANLAEQIIAQNGYSDRIEVIKKISSEITIGNEIPEPVDLLVTEIVDCRLLGEGILPTIIHARKHLVKENACIIPQAGQVFFQAFESAEMVSQNSVANVYNFDFQLFNQLAHKSTFEERCHRFEKKALIKPTVGIDFDFQNGNLENAQRTVYVEAIDSGVLEAICFWFNLNLIDNVNLSNHHENAKSHWGQGIQILKQPIYVRKGEVLKIQLNHTNEDVFVEQVTKL